MIYIVVPTVDVDLTKFHGKIDMNSARVFYSLEQLKTARDAGHFTHKPSCLCLANDRLVRVSTLFCQTYVWSQPKY